MRRCYGHASAKMVTVVVMVELGEYRGGLASLALDGAAVEHGYGELAAGKLSLELRGGFAGMRQSSWRR